jgi:hypothetical protein
MSPSRAKQSVNQGDLFLSEAPALMGTRAANTLASFDNRTDASQLRPPQTIDSESHQQVAKLAGRLNASTASDKEYNELLAERQRLVDKRLDGTITKKESIRLQYVRWSLDRIEDAKHGRNLDRLAARIDELDKVREHLEGLQKQLVNLSGKTLGKRR